MDAVQLQFLNYRGSDPLEGLKIELDVIDPNLGHLDDDHETKDHRLGTILILIELEALTALNKHLKTLDQTIHKKLYEQNSLEIINAIKTKKLDPETGVPYDRNITITVDDIRCLI
ncbi:hypothetical protein [Thalassospira sp.]|uniref:hypothetical protein n=1 Tax=Thalassospira sp. TaxID=1912094 RepID=UPI0032EADAEB